MLYLLIIATALLQAQDFEQTMNKYYQAHHDAVSDAKKILKEYGLKQLRERQRKVYEKWDKVESNIHNTIRNKISQKIDFLISN